MKLILHSIGVKVLVLTSLLTIVAFTGLFLASSYWQRKDTLHEVHLNAERTADLLQMAIEEPMRLGDNTGTEDQFGKVSKNYKDITICLTNYKGEITYSTSPDMLRKNIRDISDCDQFRAIIDKSLASASSLGDLMTMEGTANFVEIKSIENDPACHHCHGASKPILGALVMRQDVTPQLAALRMNELRNAAISLAGMAVLLVCLLLFMKYSIINRITAITSTTEEVARGDLDADFAVKGADELANLAKYLGAMVHQIKDQLEYNRSILDGVIVPLMVATREETVNFCNAPLRAILGKQKNDIVGRKVSGLFAGNGQVNSLAHDVIATGKSTSGMIRHKRTDGVEFPLHFEGSPLRDAKNNIVGAITVLIDLTQQERDKESIESQRKNLMDVADMVTSVAQNLKDSSEIMSQRMVELTSSVDTTAEQTSRVATAMEEMNATVLEVAKNAGTTAETSEEANQTARGGGDVVQATVEEIQTVASTTETLASSLNDLSGRAENIGHVMSVINDIADQTNLLALNAAIEAARAGDAGRGFAVVADEVRKLAEKTMNATKEVEAAIVQIQQGAHGAVEAMGDARERVAHTVEKAQNAGAVLSKIMEQSDVIADRVRNIATAAEEQSATSDEININVNQINELTLVLTSGIQEANNIITDVASMSQRLSELVQRFKT
ncbi:MAG: methyl-accepting chemotaxis protein [Desulfovibrionaceae bacterium]